MISYLAGGKLNIILQSLRSEQQTPVVTKLCKTMGKFMLLV
jgi:hypothetical protein